MISLPFVALAVLGSLCTLGGVVAVVLLAPPDAGVNWWYLIPGIAVGALLELAAALVLVNSRKQK
jgi:hypothetical protein